MKKLNTIQKRANLNDVFAVGEPDISGAYHRFDIVPVWRRQLDTDGSAISDFPEGLLLTVQFQEGPRYEEASTPGVLDCDLLEIVRDRLTAFQSGMYACRENACALTHIEEALMWMNRRVENRLDRGVLGTYKV